jgi:hypothetical protein
VTAAGIIEPVPQYLSDPIDVAAAYADLRMRVTGLLSGLSPANSALPVPHSPAWTVKDALAHMVGVPEDFISGNMDGVTSEAWTQAQVDRHRDDSVDDLLAIWRGLDEQLNVMVPNIPNPVVSQLVFDQVTHEQDIRHALGMPGDRESAAMVVADGFMRHTLSRQKDAAVAALAESAVTGFDFVRCLGGRRSARQVTAAGLDVTAVQAMMAVMPLSLPAGDIDE